MNSLQEDRFFSEALELEDPLTLLFVALAAFIGRLSYLLLGIYLNILLLTVLSMGDPSTHSSDFEHDMEEWHNRIYDLRF